MASESDPGASNALVRKRQADMQLMAPPPPPAKKMKRPKKVLDEESYTEGLSQIIKRDFFPGLEQVQLQGEYLDALASKDRSWISSATHNFVETKTPGSRSSMTPLHHGSVKQETPSTSRGFDTPASVAPSIGPSEKSRVNTAMRLSQYQATYTSEDNESFYRLTDRQNQKRVEKNAWLWNANKFDSKQLIKQREVKNKLLEAGTLVDDGYMKKDRLAIKDADDRPAQPELWKWKPKNELMFTPDGIEDRYETRAQKAEAASASAPKAINYHNTRAPEEAPARARASSPTMSTVRAALAGNVSRPYRNESERGSTVTGGETPRVNGYAFVDDEDDEDDGPPLPLIDLGPGDAALNPFKIQERGKKEDLLHRMVDRINKSRLETSRNGFTGRVESTPSSRFMDSPRVSAGNLTPAAQRLLGKIGASKTPRAGSSGVGGRASFAPSTPMVSRGSLIKKTPKRNQPAT